MDVSKVKESSFFKSDLTDLSQIFDARVLKNAYLKEPDKKKVHQKIEIVFKFI